MSNFSHFAVVATEKYDESLPLTGVDGFLLKWG